MKSARENNVPEILEMSILDTLESALVTAMMAFAEVYPFPAEMLIPAGDYTPLHAHSDSVATHSRALHEALRLYRKCLEQWPQEPPAKRISLEEDIPF